MSKPLTYNIDLTDWLDRAAERQRQEHGERVHKLIADAAKASDFFTDDELEEACSR